MCTLNLTDDDDDHQVKFGYPMKLSLWLPLLSIYFVVIISYTFTLLSLPVIYFFIMITNIFALLLLKYLLCY